MPDRARRRRGLRRGRPPCRGRHGLSRPLVAIVGQPNVGKSLLFNRLTGARATVSNYPGTTVNVTRGCLRLACCGAQVAVIDTPGMYALTPLTEEERVSRAILLSGGPRVVLHVVDAKNLPRMLPLTLQLLEAGLPIEASRLGLHIDLRALEQALHCPVFGTVCTTGEGIDSLYDRLLAHVLPDHTLRTAA
jgi:ferrous iron transport protein B